ncbi:MAG: ATP-binding protein [Vicinamibacterales bacterium]
MKDATTAREALNWRVPVLGFSRERVSAAVTAVAVAAFFAVGIANLLLHVTWRALEDGVLWRATGGEVVAAEIAPGSAADAAGLRKGDVLLAIDGFPVEALDDVAAATAGAPPDERLTYTVLRLGTREMVEVRLAPVPRGNFALYVLLAAVGFFTLGVGGTVRARRPADPVSRHFFWLSAAFFGTFAVSFVGRLDWLDWGFYWVDTVSALLLPPLLFHFTLMFPDRPGAWVRGAGARLVALLIYLPGLLLAAVRVLAVWRAETSPAFFAGVLQTLDRVDPLYLSVWLAGAVLVLLKAFRCVRSVTARRQLRWIIWGTAIGAGPFAFGYALPFALGVRPTLAMELTAIPLSLVPLAFASAILRYRLMDVEVIVKRLLVYAALVAAIAGIYAVLLRVAVVFFPGASGRHETIIALLATLVVVLLSRPVKNAIQAAFDRAFYRDRYDFRRALVGFARDLNADLDLARLSERLVARVMETFLVDRMALMLADDEAGRYQAIRAAGFAEPVPTLSRDSALGLRLRTPQPLSLDDPAAVRTVGVESVDAWRDLDVHYFVPCVSKERPIAVMALGRKGSGEPLNSEDLALLTAVAGQVATALENGRLYRALRLKAEEVDRMRLFNESILESLDAGLAVVDTEGRVVRWNSALERLNGVTRANALGRRLQEVFDPAFVEVLEKARSSSPRRATLSRMSLHTRHSGSTSQLVVNVTTLPLQGVHGSAQGDTVIMIEDVTSRAQLEEQLQISEKMASLGLLAAGVAHEVNTPLTGISSFTQMLLERADPSDPDTRLLEKIEQQTFRAAKIVNGLLNLSRPAAQVSGEPAPVDVHVVINDVLSLLEHQFKVNSIQVRRELNAAEPVILGHEFKLQQVFLNLVLNARDAMPKGGWLTIATRLDDGRLTIEVSDTGSGIQREHLSRIYDPFFTTKGIGQGTGLGLSITYGIVQEHQGSIACESGVGEGTRFVLSFPLAASAVRTRVAQ